MYGVLGYEYYSPLFKAGRKRWDSKFANWLNKATKNYNKICELGCGGGVWVFYLEQKQNKEILGIDNNKKMAELFNEYKRKHNMKSHILLEDARNFVDLHPNYTFLMLDNFILHFSRKELLEMFNKMDSIIIQCVMGKIEGEFEFTIAGRKIKDITKRVGENKVKRTFYSEFGSKSIDMYFYDENEILNMLKGFKIEKTYINNSLCIVCDVN